MLTDALSISGPHESGLKDLWCEPYLSRVCTCTGGRRSSHFKKKPYGSRFRASSSKASKPAGVSVGGSFPLLYSLCCSDGGHRAKARVCV